VKVENAGRRGFGRSYLNGERGLGEERGEAVGAKEGAAALGTVEMRGAERQKGGGHVLSGKRGRRGSGGSGVEGVDVGGVVLLDTAPLQLHGRRQHPVFGGPGVIVETEPGDLLERL
jgi:hypothetical protein